MGEGFAALSLPLGENVATTIYQGRVIIEKTGKAVALSNVSQEVNWLIIAAEEHNHGPLRVGSSSVTRSEASTDGPLIKAGRERPLASCNIGGIYVNGLAGDVAFWLAAYRKEIVPNKGFLEQILEELRNMNLQLSLLTDEELEVK